MNLAAITDSGQVDDEEERRYRAPALEKGLDILELITSAGKPLTVAAMTQSLGRSTGELFRMIQVLEYRGYIRTLSGGAFVPTSKLFLLGMAQAPIKSLIEAALPVMRRLAEDTEQSCHLALRAEGDIVVVARVESTGMLGFSVRLGYRRPLADSASGLVLYGNQPEQVRQRWEGHFNPVLAPEMLAAFRTNAADVAAVGYAQLPSRAVPGIIDIAAPVMQGGVAAASLAMPYVVKLTTRLDVDRSRELIVQAANDIAAELAGSEDSV